MWRFACATLAIALLLVAATAQAGLVGYWNLNESSGQIFDSAGPPFTDSTNSLSAPVYGHSSVPAGTYGALTVTPSQAAQFGTSIRLPGSSPDFNFGSAADVTVTRSMTLNSAMDFTAGGTLNSAGASLNVGPSGALTTSAPIVADSLASAGTVNAPGGTVGDLIVAGGTTTLTGNTTVTNALLGGVSGTLATQGSIALDVSGARIVNLNSQLRVESGNLTITPPAAGGGLPNGLAAYYNAAASAVTGINAAVSRLYDLSPHGRDMANVLGSPLFMATNANGLPAIRFYATDGTDAMWTDYNFDALAEYSVISADRLTGGANARVITSRTRNWLFSHHGGGDGRWYAEGWITPQGGTSNTLWDVCAGDINAVADPQANFWYNGTQTATNNTGSHNTNYKPGVLQLGAWGTGYSEPSDAEVAELFIFDRVLTATERNAVASYVASRYGVTAPGYTPTPFTNPALLGNLRLAPDAQATVAGSGIAAFNSIGTTTGPVASGPMVLRGGAPTNLAANTAGDTLTVNAAIAAANFNVTGPGTIALTQDLTVAPGGVLGVGSGATLASLNSLRIDASAATISMSQGRLDVTAGTLTVRMPLGGTVPAGAIAYWPLDQSSGLVAPDAASGTHNGSLLNMAGNEWVPGVIGNALRFDGVNDYISVADHANLRVTGDLSIAFWYQKTAEAGDWQRIFGKGNTTLRNYGVWESFGADERLLFQQYNSAGGNILQLDSVVGVPAGAWNHATCTIEGNTARIYINGVLVNTATRTGTPATSSDPLTIAYAPGMHTYFPGYLDELLFYGRALQPNEIQGLYLAGRAGAYGSPSLGNVTLANGTTLDLADGAGVSGAGVASFQSLTTGATATILGHPTLKGPMTLGSSPGTLNVTGSFTMAPGATYHWEHDGTAHDLVAVTGSVDVSNAWKLGISLGTLIPSGSYNLFTHTMGSAPPVGAVNITRENSYAQLISSASVGSDAGSVFVNLNMLANTTWTSQSGLGGTIDWHTGTNWDAGVPNLATAAIVQAPTADQVATIAGGTAGRAHTLIIDNGGKVQVNPGGVLQVPNGIWVDPTGTLRLGHGPTLDAPRVNVTGGALIGGADWPPSYQTVLGTGTTVRLAGGTMAGYFNLTNPSTTAGSYALEVESGTGTGLVVAPAASLRKSTPGSATFYGELNLNTIRVEDGSLKFAYGPQLTANTVTVTGGSLMSEKHTRIRTLDLQGGTTTLANRTTVTEMLSGRGTLVAAGWASLDLTATTTVNFGGTFRVSAANVPIDLPAISTSSPNMFPSGLIGYWPFNEGSGATTADLSSGRNPGTVNPGAEWVNDPTRGVVLNFPAAGSVTIPPAALASLANQGQVTVSLWQYGDVANQPRNDTIFHGRNAANERVLNVHLPWGDSNVYWDAGNVGGSYDRINRAAIPADFEGAWHNWVFVKDASAGSLRIYLDGNLWHSGTGLTRNMEPMTSFRVGSAADGTFNYYGMVDDFAVWNRPLGDSEIAALAQGTSVPRLGNLRLDPGSKVVLGGAGVAKFDSIGATAGPTIAGNLTAGPTASRPANIQGTGSGVHLNADVTAASFKVSGGPGTISLGNDAVLTVAPGGKLDVPAGVTVSAKPGPGGTATIDASQAAVNYKGGLNVESGTLVLDAPPPVPKPTGNLLAHLPLDGAAGGVTPDVSGNNRHANVVGSPVFVAEGVIGAAMSLNDSTDWATIPGGGNRINIDSKSFSLSIWAMRTGTTTDSDYWFGQGDTGTADRRLHAGFRNNTQATLAFYADDLNYTNAAIMTDTGNWHHWVMTYDAATRLQRIWLDGVSVASRTANGHFVSSGSNDFWIGNVVAGNAFGGLLDEALVYDRLLTSGEIQNLYQAGLQGGYGAARFGDLTMARDTRLVATTAPVGFSSATLGNNATLIGDITLVRRLALGSTAFVDGHLRISDGLVYDWVFRDTSWHDLVTVLGDLHFEKSFTLNIFAAGSLNPTDMVPIFLYSGILEVAGDPNKPLDYVIELGNLNDPRYIWDASAAELWVGLGPAGQGIYLTGLFVEQIPEPGTLTLLALGALALMRRRRSARRAP